MFRQAFSYSHIFDTLSDYGISEDQALIGEIIPTSRGSVAVVNAHTGNVIVKFADLNNEETEGAINPPRSHGLRNEASILGALSIPFCPGLIHLLNGSTGVGIITEFISGVQSLKAVKEGLVQPDKLALELISRVNLVHENGEVLHGDIHPSNVLVSGNVSVGLIDFEFSHLVDGPALAPGLYNYLSPEASKNIIEGKQPILDQREETFALTATCLSLLSGQIPYDYGGHNTSKSEALIIQASNPVFSDSGVPERFQTFSRYLKKLLGSHIFDRPSTPMELHEAVNIFVDDTQEKDNLWTGK